MPNNKPLSPEEKEKQLKAFLDITRKIESSDGRNTNHATMESGIHAGDAAIGAYGIMPNTVKEFAKRTGNPELSRLSALDAAKMKQEIESNPELEEQVARPIAEHVLSKYGDPRMANFAYQYGHNMDPERVKELYRTKGADRLAKFDKYEQELLAAAPPVQEEPIPQPQEPDLLSKIKQFFTQE